MSRNFKWTLLKNRRLTVVHYLQKDLYIIGKEKRKQSFLLD